MIKFRRMIFGLCLIGTLFSCGSSRAADLSSEKVLRSIDRAKLFLVSQQAADGSWEGGGQFKVGVTSLSLLALLNAGMTVDEEPVQFALAYLRSVKDPEFTYEVSLMIMALAAAKDGKRDNIRISSLVDKLEKTQIRTGGAAGAWSYGSGSAPRSIGDHSNTQFAILGLRDAVHAGVSVSPKTWKLSRDHWMATQTSDGGWGYSATRGGGASGSMTVAGIASMLITSSMLRYERDFDKDGNPICCGTLEQSMEQKSLDRGIAWMERRFAIGRNTGAKAWLLYYLYGLERAGRLSGRRFFGDHDWYREGAEFLVDRQSKRSGEWQGNGAMERNPVIGTSLALLFLSKGLAPVLMNKLEFKSEGDNAPIADKDKKFKRVPNWNINPNDARNLTNLVTGLPKWPKLVTWQVIDIESVLKNGDVRDLLQSPVIYLSGKDKPQFTDRHVALLKEYIIQGGFIFAVNCCGPDNGFHEGFLELIEEMYPNGEAKLKKLTVEHPIYRSEYLLFDAKTRKLTAELYGVDFGCRTAIVYSPEDFSCLWDKWNKQDPPKEFTKPRKNFVQSKILITRATRVGVNVLAYATGREPPVKLKEHEISTEEGRQDKIERGFLQIPKLRHDGGWDAAPQALRNLLLSLNRTVGMAASTKERNLIATDSNIFKYPIVYMHGRSPFSLTRQEKNQLKKYLKQGGVLFADACCGSTRFDRSFREVLAQVFPDQPLKRIPATHEMFTSEVGGHDIRQVQRRSPETSDEAVALNTIVKKGEPFLEGIELDGRYAVIYSKYDISCALERQRSVMCTGYVPDDATKIAINVILYSMQQDIR